MSLRRRFIAALKALWLGVGALLLVSALATARAQPSAADTGAPASPAAAAASSFAPPVLRYGVLANFPPFQVWPQGSRPGGADHEVSLELARRAGVVLEAVRYSNFAQLEADLVAGRIHLASAMARTPGREQQLLFSPPYIQVPLALVTRADSPSAALLPDLAGRSIAVVSGYASSEQADRLFPLASRVLVATVAEGLRAVRDGRADTLLEALPVLADLIEREQITGLSIVRRVDAPSGRMHLALHPSQGRAAAALAQAVRDYPPGRVDSLLQAWSVKSLQPQAGTLVLSEADRGLLGRWPAPVIGIVGKDPPFASANSQGDATGLSVDLLKAVLGHLGVQAARWVLVDPADLQQALLQRRVDIVLGADENADRTPLLRFVGPYIEYPTVLIGRPESGAFDLDQLQGRRLALTPNSVARPLVDSRHPSITVFDCSDVDSCIDAVVDGRADATLSDVVTSALVLANRPRPEVQMIGSEPRLRRFHSLALADRHAEVVPLFKRALDVAQQADLPALKTRWFSRPSQQDVVRAVALRYGPWAAGLLLLLCGLWLWHSTRLRAQVQRTQAAQAQAERAADVNRRFTTFLAHEVRNSLHAVVAGTELAQLPAQAGPEVNKMLAESARSTLHLLNNLIDRERLHVGRLVLHPEAEHLGPLVQAVVQEMTPAAQVRGLQLRCSLPDTDTGSEPLLLLDGLRLQQVLRNLLSNAIKYSADGVVEVEARLSWPAGRLPGAAVHVDLAVSDRGQGITEAERVALFEPFQAAPGRASSAGLGLPLCLDLARLMGGTLAVEARAGGGTVARLQFDTQPADLTVPARPAARPEALRVLVVEDAEVYSMLLVRAFEQRGHQAQGAATLQAARGALANTRFDLVLCDLNLPDGTARELLLWLAQGGPGTPQAAPRLVVMTADRASAPPALEALLRGQHLLEKTDDVRALVERALRAGEALSPETRVPLRPSLDPA